MLTSPDPSGCTLCLRSWSLCEADPTCPRHDLQGLGGDVLARLQRALDVVYPQERHLTARVLSLLLPRPASPMQEEAVHLVPVDPDGTRPGSRRPPVPRPEEVSSLGRALRALLSPPIFAAQDDHQLLRALPAVPEPVPVPVETERTPLRQLLALALALLVLWPVHLRRLHAEPPPPPPTEDHRPPAPPPIVALPPPVAEGLSALTKGWPVLARRLCREASSPGPHRATALVCEGRAVLSFGPSGRWPLEAVRLARAALRERDHAEARVLLGDGLRAQDKCPEARPEYLRVLEYHPDHAAALAGFRACGGDPPARRPAEARAPTKGGV